MENEIKISRWNAVDYIECQEDIDNLIEVAFESGDVNVIIKTLETVIKAYEKLYGNRMPEVGKQLLHDDSFMYGVHCLQELTAVIDNLGYRLSVVPKSRVSHSPAN